MRTIVALLLAVLVCVSFLAFLTVSKVRSTVLEPTFYTSVLEANDSYNAIYEELLAELEHREEVEQLREELGMDSEEFERLAREVVTPSFVKAQIDGIITGVLGYLRGEVEDPQIFIDLSQPIERMRPVSLDYVDRRVESAELVYPTTAAEYAEEARTLIEYLERGAIPPRVPSLANVPEQTLENALDQVLPVLSYLDPRTAASLETQWEAVRAEALSQPESPEAMKLAARAVVSPYIDEAIASVRAHLDDHDRLDLVEAAAEASEMPREEFVEEVDAIRDPINTLQGVGPTAALLVLALATVLLALVNLPHRVSMIMWPSIALIVAGFIAIIVAALLSAFLPNVSYEICGDAADFACEPALDILRELTRSMGDFPIFPSVALIFLGGMGVTVAAIIMSRGASASASPMGGQTGGMGSRNSNDDSNRSW